VSFNQHVEDIVQVIEGTGVAVMVIGGLGVLVRSAALWFIPARRRDAYGHCRRHLGRVILLGLEILIIADIIRTVIVDQTPTSVAVLATIVIIRIVLSWSLEVEMDGAWPWQRGRSMAGQPGPTFDGPTEGG
jgi:uncharacterized membrane protein